MTEMSEVETHKYVYTQLSRYSDKLRTGRSGDRNPPLVQTGPGSHTTLRVRGTVSLSPGVKRQGRDLDHPHSSRTEVKERVELYLYDPSGSSWSVLLFIL